MSLVTTDKRKFMRFNWFLLGFILLILTIGLINLNSASCAWGEAGKNSLIWSQLTWIAIGLFIMFFVAFFDYRLIEKGAYPIYLTSIILLLAVFIFGKVVAGHKSWLVVGGLSIQPTEFAKLSLVVILSRYFSRNPHPEGAGLLELWKPVLYTVVPALLVVLQGDLGSALFFGLIFSTYAWIGRLRGRGIIVLVLVTLVAVVLVYFFGLANYQRARITNFINPTQDAKGSGYHLIQSRIAVGSGGFFGKGYLKGNVNKLKFLPEKHTDFIFPVLAEEWGFVGGVFVLLIYFLIFYTGLDIAKSSQDRTGLFLSIGVVAFLFWQFVINLGGVLGLMPLTGVTLPLMSYGGSATITVLAAMGILFSVNMRRCMF